MVGGQWEGAVAIDAVTVWFEPAGRRVEVPKGTSLSDAAHRGGVELNLPCGGQGRCGRCLVKVQAGEVVRRSTQPLSAEDVNAGYALACQTEVQGPVTVVVPPQVEIDRHLVDRKVSGAVEPWWAYSIEDQPIRGVVVRLEPPSLADQVDDWTRLREALAEQHAFSEVQATLPVLGKLGSALRDEESEADGAWQVTVVLALDEGEGAARVLDVRPGLSGRLWGVAIDIGTTSNVVWLVDLSSGEVVARKSAYNDQIARGTDVISRIIYAGKDGGLAELQELVMGTLNGLLEEAVDEVGIATSDIYRALVAGNSTMHHLFAGISPASIRESPFVTTANRLPPFPAREVGLGVNPEALVDCLPGVGAYVGADVSAGVVSSRLCELEAPALFIDIGTNGEIVLGDCDWLITAACSAGPAFEGEGVRDGMRATVGAIEEVWIAPDTLEATVEVIGGGEPRGICGSGLISLLGELVAVGIIDRRGNFDLDLKSDRVREGDQGPEYVVVWGQESATGRDIVITSSDVENLMRAKAAIYAGCSVLAENVGLSLEEVDRVLVGGAFGEVLNVEQAIAIGMLPDLPRERFQFLGNTSIRGAYLALLSDEVRAQIDSVAKRMTYVELSADRGFFDAFNAAMFLPHTDEAQFPSVVHSSTVSARSGRE